MASLICPFCGTENPTTRSFCRKCASDLHAPVREPGAPVAPPPASVPMRPIVIGGGIALVVIALIIGAVLFLGGAPAASPSPPAPSASVSPTAAATAVPTAEPTEGPVATTAATPEETLPGTPGPSASGDPIVDSLKGPRSASCTADNGTGTPGYVHLTWTASNTTGVRLSIDPPTPNTAYDYGYDDYPATGSADLPFTCDPPSSDSGGAYHEYVATTVHEGGRYAWRFIKVYLKP